MPAELRPLALANTPFDPLASERVINYWTTEDGKTYYKVWLSLEGSELPLVRRVTYLLHPTFTRREVVVERSFSNPQCSYVIWTWGTFRVRAVIERKDGRVRELVRELDYPQAFKMKDVRFERVSTMEGS